MMAEIIITLKSDLCAADGDGFAAAIDADVCTDRCGLPIIPARRLKGCLRDAARLIGTNEAVIDEIFGVRGSNSCGALRLSDARLLNAEELSRAAETSRGITPAMLTDLFTYTRASTAISEETGSAKEQSLRFVRVVKHFDPFDGTELRFSAKADIPEKYAGEFSRICRALRNIGFKRNRGLGAVRCELSETAEETAIPAHSFSPDREYTLRYTVRLSDDVMISGSSSDESLDFIPGSSLLGFFANEYLKTHEAESAFEEIFLKNGVRFSNLYISDKNGAEYFPAPVVAGKIKGVNHPVNVLMHDLSKSDSVVKPLKSGYTNLSLNLRQPLTETVYHISRESDSGLYMQTALRKGQFFSGSISGKGALLGGIFDILRGGVVRVGRSKTAQYSVCCVVPESVCVQPAETRKIRLCRGEVFVAAAISDVLLPDGMCGYVSDMGSFAGAAAKAFGFGCDTPDSGMEIKRSALRFRTVHGFNTQWGLSKPHLRAIAAGSAAVFTADTDYELPEELWLGDKNGEGFGCIRLIKSSELSFRPEEEETPPEEAARLFEKALAAEQMRLCALDFSAAHNLGISSAQINRAALMAKQAVDFGDFITRIENITDERTRDSLSDFFGDKKLDVPKSDWREFVLLLLTLEKYKARTKEENA